MLSEDAKIDRAVDADEERVTGLREGWRGQQESRRLSVEADECGEKEGGFFEFPFGGILAAPLEYIYQSGLVAKHTAQLQQRFSLRH